MKKLNKKGFTIVELVIVISVIAILSAVMVPTFSNVISNSKDSAALQSAKNAYTEYMMDCAESEDNKEAELNLIYKGENGRWVVIKDGQVSKTVCASEDEAKEKLGLIEGDDPETEDVTEVKNYTDEVITENLTAYKIAVAEEGEGA